jgi:hypothetical protein
MFLGYPFFELDKHFVLILILKQAGLCKDNFSPFPETSTDGIKKIVDSPA